MLRTSCEVGGQTDATCEQVNSGVLVRDDLVNAMVAARITAADCKSGFLLDGYPRTVPQASFLQTLIGKCSLPEPTIIHLDVPHSVLLARVTARRQCPECGKIYNLIYSPPAESGICDADGQSLTRRADDEDQVVDERLKSYEQMAGPLMQHYRAANYHRLDGNRPADEISEEIERRLQLAARASQPPGLAQKQTSAPVHR